jgi:cystathionine beta-synthase
VDSARDSLQKHDALMVVDDGQPIGVLTRHDLLAFLAR